MATIACNVPVDDSSVVHITQPDVTLEFSTAKVDQRENDRNPLAPRAAATLVIGSSCRVHELETTTE